MPGDAAGKELQASLCRMAQQLKYPWGKGVVNCPRQGKRLFPLSSAPPSGEHSHGELLLKNIKPPPESQHKPAARSGESSDHHPAAASLKQTCMKAEVQH